MPSGSQGRAGASKHPQSRQVVLNPYRIMWLIVMFDLPTVKTEERRDYQLFHKYLLADGFSMMQYSIYMRFCASPELYGGASAPREARICRPRGRCGCWS